MAGPISIMPSNCGFRIFRVEDEPTFVACLSDRVSSPNPEDLKIAAYNHLRSQRMRWVQRYASEMERRILFYGLTKIQTDRSR
jgi:hypothetical protein